MYNRIIRIELDATLVFKMNGQDHAIPFDLDVKGTVYPGRPAHTPKGEFSPIDPPIADSIEDIRIKIKVVDGRPTRWDITEQVFDVSDFEAALWAAIKEEDRE